jgi:hypothetical protein
MISTILHAGDLRTLNKVLKMYKYDRSGTWIWGVITLIAIATLVAAELGVI